MKRFILLCLTAAGCATAPDYPPQQVTSSGLRVTASGLPVMSGNYAAIPPGQPGSGSEGGNASR